MIAIVVYLFKDHEQELVTQTSKVWCHCATRVRRISKSCQMKLAAFIGDDFQCVIDRTGYPECSVRAVVVVES